jgi:thiamine-phosphate pyrophosphorylase
VIAAAPRVLLITDDTHPRGLVTPVVDALRGLAPTGRRLHVQLRGPSVSDEDLLRAGRALAPVLAAVNAALVINSRAGVALALGADGLHLKEQDDAERARAIFAAGFISRACHDTAGLTRARAEGAAYAVLSPVFDVPGKNAALGLDGFARAAGTAGLPVVGLGGITQDTASSVISSGAAGVAMIRSVLHAPSPAQTLQLLLDTLR